VEKRSGLADNREAYAWLKERAAANDPVTVALLDVLRGEAK
jgi:hypothetical protein